MVHRAGDRGADSKELLMDAAERLFAERGFAATSLRRITAEAGVNLAAVNYHFGSKEGLIEAVFERCIRPLSSERLRLLDEAEARSGGRPSVELILESFVTPVLRAASRPSAQITMKLYGRTHSAPDSHVREIFLRQFGGVRERFTAALAHALPHLPRAELYWRLHFAIGAVAQAMADPERLVVLSDGACDPYDADATIARLVPFLAAGLRTPWPVEARE
ncbi:MAG: TetR family transcriptional regulator [Candidatus Latescibacterota bacterium]|nr:MAG: TetR family transcriptional regulator [Candidatus Latescibacterota bacterium]